MSTLTTTRIREHALKLGMTHLSDTISELVARAEANQMGYLDLVDLLLGEELGIREGRRFRNALKLSTVAEASFLCVSTTTNALMSLRRSDPIGRRSSTGTMW